MNGKALVGALIGGAVGAGVWAIIAATTGFEVGYVAWGVGIAVGIGARRLGGEGRAMGVVCAFVALASIFIGKMWAFDIAMPSEMRKAVHEMLTEEGYRELVTDAKEFAKAPSEAEYPKFMVEHGYSEAESPENVTQEEVQAFKTQSVSMLEDMHREQPTFEQWRNAMVRETTEKAMKEVDVVEAVVEDLGPIDLIFAFLGLATAFKLVASGDAAA